MINISRRALAVYAADRLAAGESAGTLAQRLAATLIANKSTVEAESLVADIAEVLEDRGQLARATVTSATVLSDKLRKSIRRLVKSAIKVDEVMLVEKIDPACIGGVKIETAKLTWDRTVARKLAAIKGGN